ncbi:hypothetical protein N7462_007539 [Penicillium macrosclerotiorum]|uniref:uncharacterized protein n=1 Tax=Penicillium macrosclerotiorum TaxID=303699 RepID=UPI002547FE9E|nr:uncharacterized protein N7462_007539 [Penicillium macrosclerotiorum]KAJ5679295.1 hypothetical protein N7462_007539 [Penicillium macrosclerotiorum]
MSRNENENEIDDESCRSSDDTFKDISQSSPREGRMFFRFNDGNSDTSFSEPEVEEPSSIYSGRIRRMRPPSDLLNEARWNNSNDDMLTDKSLSADEYLDCASGEMGWFWVCQIDVIPGYFATPWTARFSTDICIGAIAVIIEALGIVTDFSQPAYLEISCHPRGLAWMRSGYSTFPPYGVSANHHHGTVISGAYDTQSLPGFRDPLFPIELLGHYGFQVDGRQPSDAANLRARLTELMALDSWLSYCGRQPEICGYGHGINNGATVTGAGDLLYTMPTLVKRTMDSFSLEFTNLERTAINGGQQLVRQIAVNLLDTLGWKVEGLSPAEKLFALVAMLRASKMALCISQGTDTSALRDIMLNDVQAHLV